MRYVALTTAAAMAFFAATANAAALNGRQVVPPVGPSPWCTNWKSDPEANPETCGKEGTTSGIFCLNGRLCFPNLHFDDDQMREGTDEDNCHCPEDCTTDGNGNCA